MSGSERPIRVLLIGRHFWPHGSIDSAGHLIELASGLKLAGQHVSVLTPKYAASWPEHFSFREVDVYRPIRVFRTGWTARGDRTASRYIRNLRDWIESNPVACDVVYCDGGREEAIAAVEAARANAIPSVIRIAGRGACSDFDFFTHSRSGKRCRSSVLGADAVVVGGASDERRWLAHGGVPERVHRIPIGVGPSLDLAPSEKKELRLSMARINGDLFVPEACSVVLTAERLRDDSGVMTLVKSAYSLSQKINALQFWLVGDGSSRESIFARLNSDGLRQVTSMPGSFGLMDDVFSAADLMVQVGDEGFEHQVPTAISAALPIVVANTNTAREFFSVTDEDVRGRILDNRNDVLESPNDLSGSAGQLIGWFDPARPKTLRFAIDQIVCNVEAARGRAQQLRRRLQRVRSRGESIRCYARLFRELTGRVPARVDRQTSMEKQR